MMDDDKSAANARIAQMPALIFTVGVTGHREGNFAFSENRERIADTLGIVLESLAAALRSEANAIETRLRLVTNLANGSDLISANLAGERGYEVYAALPFGRDVNYALNMLDGDWQTMAAVAGGAEPEDGGERANRKALQDAHDAACCFELADGDERLRWYLDRFAKGATTPLAIREFDGQVAKRTRLASRITVEQSDVLLAVWDGTSPTTLGGTLDTMTQALATDIPVVWIDARDPARLHWLEDIADLAVVREREAAVPVDEIVERVALLASASISAIGRAYDELAPGRWRLRSRRRFHAYRRIERMFSGDKARFASLVQRYEAPEDIASGSARGMTEAIAALPGMDGKVMHAIERRMLPRFALADGISTYLSDAYRGGMVASFLLSAAAIIGGLAYLPLVGPEGKWPFALLELTLLACIVAITVAGTRGEWHRRWFRTRRVAEYLRHAPVLSAVGANRPKGHWPVSRDEQWPELYARQVAMAAGLPGTRVTKDFLRDHLNKVLQPFLVSQRDYHRKKAARLAKVHHNLDRLSETLFLLAIVSVGLYLVLEAGGAAGAWPAAIPASLSKLLTFFGVAFPTLGAAIAGIRYFGDFERFAAISDITAAKLDRLIRRSGLLLESRRDEINYADFVDLAHATDDVVLEEIESWQSIFGTKRMSVPV